MKNLLPWQVIGMNLAALGTAISFAKFIFVPFSNAESKPAKPGFWPAVGLLLAGLFVANVAYYEAYTLANTIKPWLPLPWDGWPTCLFFSGLFLNYPASPSSLSI
jgi:multicomponent Na+:H+ antiporter subunit D